MPIYEYYCKSCGEKFEEFQSIGATNEDIVCPNCGALKPDRVFSAFSSTGAVTMGTNSSCGPVGSPFS